MAHALAGLGYASGNDFAARRRAAELGQQKGQERENVDEQTCWPRDMDGWWVGIVMVSECVRALLAVQKRGNIDEQTWWPRGMYRWWAGSVRVSESRRASRKYRSEDVKRRRQQ